MRCLSRRRRYLLHLPDAVRGVGAVFTTASHAVRLAIRISRLLLGVRVIFLGAHPFPQRIVRYSQQIVLRQAICHQPAILIFGILCDLYRPLFQLAALIGRPDPGRALFLVDLVEIIGRQVDSLLLGRLAVIVSR